MGDILNRKNGDPNVGSLSKIFFKSIDELDDPTFLPIAVINKAALGTDPVSPNDMTSSWNEAEYSMDTPLWDTTEEATPQGTLYKEKVTWVVAKDYDFRRLQFDDMEGREFALWVADNNATDAGGWKFFGYQSVDGQRRGMRFSKAKTTGELRTKLNYWTLTFYMESFVLPWNAEAP